MTPDRLNELMKKHDNNVSAVAKELDLSRSTVRSYLARYARKGLTGAPELIKVKPGLDLAFVTQHAKKTADGKIEIVEEWGRQKPDAELYQMQLEALEDYFEKYNGIIPEIPLVREEQAEDLLTVYVIADHHLGLYSWEPETGANYDLKIAQDILRSSIGELVGRTPNSKYALVLNVGDYFHADDDLKRTRRSGNVLDVDGRSSKVLELGVDLEIEAVSLVASKHECIEVRNLRGNHDPDLSVALNVAVRKAFANNPRVHISRDPSSFYFKEFGSVLIGATHGDFTKPAELPGIMAAYAPEAWGRTKHRYFYFGHIHHSSKGGDENHGALWESFRTLAPRDAWATASGYAAGRSMVAITHHRRDGEKYRDTVSYSGPGYKKGL